MMNNQPLTHSLYQIGAIQFGEFKLKSGLTTPVYVNLRKIISYPELLRAVANALWHAVSQYPFDLVCGVPYTALPIATCLSLEHHVPMIIKRKEQKNYGTKQIIEGEFKPGQRCLIIEDVITTGVSVLETAVTLEKAGLIIQDIAALIDREQGGREQLTKKYTLHTIFTLSDLLQSLLHSTLLNPVERQLTEQFLKERASTNR